MAAAAPVMAVVGMGMQIAGSVVNAFSAEAKGEAQGRMYDYKAQVAKVNAQIAEQNANYARQTGEVSAQRQGMKTRYETGKMMVKQSGSGFSVNMGTPAAVRDSIHTVGQQEEAIIRADAAKRAYGFDVESYQARTQAELDTFSAAGAREEGRAGFWSSLLGGATSVASKWGQASTSFGSSTGSQTGLPNMPGSGYAPFSYG